MPIQRTLSSAAVAILTAIAVAPLSAQGHDRGDMAGMHDMKPAAAVSATARRQIDSVARAITPLGAPGAAASAGFRPVFGWIPTWAYTGSIEP